MTARAVILGAVNFNVYLDDELVRRLDALSKRTGIRRNALIREAVGNLVRRRKTTWPDIILEWKGEPDAVPFEDARSELAEPADDPFGAPGRSTARSTKPRVRARATATRSR
jgi:predicted transcriptional regulator